MKRLGFTLFEVLAVLTVIGIVLTLVIGNYGSWGTAHALEGAARTVEAGLQQARALAMAQRIYIAFNYGCETTSGMKTVTGFQPFFCTNNNDAAINEIDLNDLAHELDDAATFIPRDGVLFKGIVIEPAAPFQRLSGHVRLARLTGDPGASSLETTPVSIIVFRPDGSVIADDVVSLSSPDPYHYVILGTTESFSVSPTATEPLVRVFRIDSSTGLATLLGDAP